MIKEGKKKRDDKIVFINEVHCTHIILIYFKGDTKVYKVQMVLHMILSIHVLVYNLQQCKSVHKPKSVAFKFDKMGREVCFDTPQST